MLRAFIEAKQRGAERFAAAFAPTTRFGLLQRNRVIKAFAIPGRARMMFRRDIADTLPLPADDWPSLSRTCDEARAEALARNRIHRA